MPQMAPRRARRRLVAVLRVENGFMGCHGMGWDRMGWNGIGWVEWCLVRIERSVSTILDIKGVFNIDSLQLWSVIR